MDIPLAKRRHRETAFLIAAAMLAATTCRPGVAAPREPNLLSNPGFEDDVPAGSPAQWEPFWTRDAGAGTAAVEKSVRHQGNRSLHVTTTGAHDWSEGQSGRLTVSPGEIYALGAWVKCQNTAQDTGGDDTHVTLSVVTRRADGSVIDWQYGHVEARGDHDWTFYSRRFVVPADCATIQFRFTGNGAVDAWFDDALLLREGNALRTGVKPHAPLTLTNSSLKATIDAATGALTVRSGKSTWIQKPVSSNVIVTGCRQLSPRLIQLHLLDIEDAMPFSATFSLAPKLPEIRVKIMADAAAKQTGFLEFPHPFLTGAGSSLIVPLNEGIAYPADDPSVAPLGQLVAYGGHGICMPWWGATAGMEKNAAGVQAIIGTPNDARVEIARTLNNGHTLYVRPLWESQKGEFGYDREITYVFSDAGGYVGQAKHYRRWAASHGLFKALAEKRKRNPNIDRLIGAANIWNWDLDKVALCKEMKSLGMDHVLWSNGGNANEVKAINALGYLTSRYDIYQDVWPPGSPGLTTAGWPEDLVRLPNGDFMKGWADIRKENGVQKVYQGGVISSGRGLARARQMVPEELAKIPYLCRFLDTTTASPFREDYNPDHSLTRTQDRQYKMDLLKFCSHDERLVTGSETGLDAAVPYVDYFEGMLSLGPYRLPDAGRNIQDIVHPTPDLLKYQVGTKYRIPLWELVYHDCVVANWYWGDYNNKVPEVWDRRDLFNILYGTPPMFMFDRAIWTASKAHFVQSYMDICPIVRRLGYDEMMTHEFLTADHDVQRTTWKSGATISVNFGDKPYESGNAILPPHRWQISIGSSKLPQ